MAYQAMRSQKIPTMLSNDSQVVKRATIRGCLQFSIWILVSVAILVFDDLIRRLPNQPIASIKLDCGRMPRWMGKRKGLIIAWEESP
jgi:hypothetical protein